MVGCSHQDDVGEDITDDMPNCCRYICVVNFNNLVTNESCNLFAKKRKYIIVIFINFLLCLFHYYREFMRGGVPILKECTSVVTKPDFYFI